ncbi:class I poly(R)-hydroxyalkanoic acid synthase [Propionivibrio sp.]|uniref:PHA/PHB synthase family protein n=1 Tax=Propionivibrio sp. TaxID=2212460 RepID=UPI0025CEFE71|nr:class I poly(R)-hydroxyalkanoic acid synthase [Propionivibrio sp.]MBK8744269.1 class I poly(R)-hydroxyalkanoic acid synthase [Propionivibrio sp.]
MSTEQSAASMQGFYQAGQALTQAYLDFVTGQQLAFLLPASAPVASSTPLPIPSLEPFASLQQELATQHAQLLQSMLLRQPGQAAEPVVRPEAGDRRFKAPEWNESPFYSYLQQAYLLNASYLAKVAESLPITDGPTRTRMQFLTRLYVDAMAPSNFAVTNPEFIKTALETNGESIAEGIRNMLADLEKGRISMTDEAAFEIGGNIATTPGDVVFENDLMQLIQYAPSTDKVAERPILLVPPCINKYYLMDLQAENSFVRYIVAQGFTVFLISWRSATEAQGHYTWDDYLEMGPIKALTVVREITGMVRPNALGFCIGGPLLCSALAVLKARGEDPVESLTLMTALLDYSDPGEIGALVTEATVAAYEASIGKGGVLHGRELSNVFSALRANDLIWQYVVGNYLKGKKPEPFDLLYWNSDSTNLPGPCFTQYLRYTYLTNALRVPGKLEMLGEKVDLGKITVPSYIMAAREDHLVLWQGAYLSRKILGGPTLFTLAASGHIAGSINPASKNRRNYWVNDSGAFLTPDEWLAGATEKQGSWWPHWAEWLGQRSGKKIAAPKKPGSTSYQVIEPAPGRYVKVRT